MLVFQVNSKEISLCEQRGFANHKDCLKYVISRLSVFQQGGTLNIDYRRCLEISHVQIEKKNFLNDL